MSVDDAGAFPDVRQEQFPLRLGVNRPAFGTFAALRALALGEVSNGGSNSQAHGSLMVVHAGGAQLAARQFDASELSRADADAIAEEQRRTKAAIDSKLSTASARPRQRVTTLQSQTGQERSVAIVDASKDPLDPKRPRVKKTQQVVAAADAAPIVRSPTRPPADPQQSAEGFKLPAATKSWTNPKHLLIAVEKREEADGRNYLQRTMGNTHADLAAAMRAAEQEVVEEAAARVAAEQQRKTEQQLADEQRLEDRAREAVRSETAAAPMSREERLARRREEAEMRDRVREERQRQRRIAKTADRLGIDVDATSASDALRQQVLDFAPVAEGGELDPRLQYAKGARHGTAGAEDAAGENSQLYAQENMFGRGGTERPIDVAAVQREMAVQDAQTSGGQRDAVLGSIDDLDDQPVRRQPAPATERGGGGGGGGGFGIDDLLP
uniref:SKI-interacting protein SKIP SNW domain-containing protein n=1 Tax=Neobodo designis TaxID=312471 RepID=A0A7S1QU89_NEODS|mmetsp:Transcript_5244/g.16638  ORF Transcript_5244/g.16638 Transcript_5244/m.16638 type:complete len:440 (+) Transcript_5244:35-1354(+)